MKRRLEAPGRMLQSSKDFECISYATGASPIREGTGSLVLQSMRGLPKEPGSTGIEGQSELVSVIVTE